MLRVGTPAFFHSASSGGPVLDLACDHIAFPSPFISGWLQECFPLSQICLIKPIIHPLELSGSTPCYLYMQISVLTIPVHAFFGQLHFIPFQTMMGLATWAFSSLATLVSSRLCLVSPHLIPELWQNYPNLLTCDRGEVMCAAGHEWDGVTAHWLL